MDYWIFQEARHRREEILSAASALRIERGEGRPERWRDRIANGALFWSEVLVNFAATVREKN